MVATIRDNFCVVSSSFAATWTRLRRCCRRLRLQRLSRALTSASANDTKETKLPQLAHSSAARCAIPRALPDAVVRNSWILHSVVLRPPYPAGPSCRVGCWAGSSSCIGIQVSLIACCRSEGGDATRSTLQMPLSLGCLQICLVLLMLMCLITVLEMMMDTTPSDSSTFAGHQGSNAARRDDTSAAPPCFHECSTGPRAGANRSQGDSFFGRTVCLAVIVVAPNIIANRWGALCMEVFFFGLCYTHGARRCSD